MLWGGIAAVVACIGSVQGEQTLQLEKLVIFSRHGIRVPYQPPGGADNFSRDGREWFVDPAQWGGKVEAGLTEHGAGVVRKMGGYYNETQAQDGLRIRDGEFTVYTNNEPTNRTFDTAVNFFQGATNCAALRCASVLRLTVAVLCRTC